MNWDSFLSFLGSALGCIGGILASQKLTNHRLQMLEEQVKKHNNVLERTFKLEEHKEKTDSEIKDIKSDIKDLRDLHMEK